MIDWTALGLELRQLALDAHDGELPDVAIAYRFLLANPECFGQSEWPDSAVNECIYEWPADMPQEPNIELIAAYYNVRESER